MPFKRTFQNTQSSLQHYQYRKTQPQICKFSINFPIGSYICMFASISVCGEELNVCKGAVHAPGCSASKLFQWVFNASKRTHFLRGCKNWRVENGGAIHCVRLFLARFKRV
ncbi:hypothetical protein CEXT_550971 [Caerostris extrusa]|uniref:Uncharacterized protein n=1 Tax=Caerostris extrusa TaxID=172846 RepID=A0AAV4U644_CAEEX|nr:hypothetical protein CEXT_550971 [Caerostris extrusa]